MFHAFITVQCSIHALNKPHGLCVRACVLPGSPGCPGGPLKPGESERSNISLKGEYDSLCFCITLTVCECVCKRFSGIQNDGPEGMEPDGKSQKIAQRSDRLKCIYSNPFWRYNRPYPGVSGRTETQDPRWGGYGPDTPSDLNHTSNDFTYYC